MLFIATRSRATTLRIRFIFDCYRLPCLIVSSLSAFKGGRKEEGRKEEWRRRRSSPLSPLCRKLVRCASMSRFLQLPWNRGSRPRCEIAAVLQPALVSCEFQPVFTSIRDPRASFFFFYARADFFPRLSFLESDIKEGTWSWTKEMILFASHICSNVLFFFSFLVRFIEWLIM